MKIISNSDEDFSEETQLDERGERPTGVFVVTDIRPALKNKERVNIFLDQKFAFSLTIAEVVDEKLKVGAEISSERRDALKTLSEFGKLYETTLMWALARPRSEREIRDYLEQKRRKCEVENRRYEEFLEKVKTDPEYREKVKKIREETRKKNQKLKEKDWTQDNRAEYVRFYRTNLPVKPAANFGPEVVEKLVEKLRGVGLVDDVAFAKFYVENRSTRKGISRRKLELELARKGIDRNTISEAFSGSERDDAEEIKKIILKKRRKYPDDEKMISYLCRQGFDFELARNLLREMDSQNSE